MAVRVSDFILPNDYIHRGLGFRTLTSSMMTPTIIILISNSTINFCVTIIVTLELPAATFAYALGVYAL